MALVRSRQSALYRIDLYRRLRPGEAAPTANIETIETGPPPEPAYARSGEMVREAAGSRVLIERAVGAPCSAIAAPFGEANDRFRRIARRCGYRLGLTAAPGFAQLGGDPLRLPRLEVAGDWSIGIAVRRRRRTNRFRRFRRFWQTRSKTAKTVAGPRPRRRMPRAETPESPGTPGSIPGWLAPRQQP